MNHVKFFQPASRRTHRTIQLTVSMDLVRALRRLSSQERKTPEQLCVAALSVYANSVFQGKSLQQFADCALIPIAKAKWPPAKNVNELLVEEIADALERGEDTRKEYRGNIIAPAQAYEVVRQRKTRNSGKWSWTKHLTKPSSRWS
jgi:hypothetical protein